MEIYFSKVRPVKSPSHGTDHSAGWDFFIPDYNKKFEVDFKEKNSVGHIEDGKIVVPAWGDAIIPSGIKVNLPLGWHIVAMNKSGIATKQKLTVGACVVDTDYQGEIHLHLINTSNKPVRLDCGTKVIQFLPYYQPYLQMLEKPIKELYNKETSRGEGGFGSTGIH